MIGWILIIATFGFFCYYGYHLLVKHGAGGVDPDALTAACHLCRAKFPVRDMVARDKEAGFVNYFCEECVIRLYEDLKNIHNQV